ncbi:hypothetical protein SAMN05192555_10157 [Franzmannia pantelleriensis]|uniref:Zinc resistance-associated protein n=1 Tax=Franzmannia pantelleriensis TaxID=48727 RepID=A0A1G9EBX9_9GAMM|nr:hypothetical protein [Halomonas pantelleriensis]SDK73581.1 hypothetical protein SAMN05192555_10157 [Halomonas pantelleriensis]
MTLVKRLAAPMFAALVAVPATAIAQDMGQGMAPQQAAPSPEEQVAQLDEMVGLDQAQQDQIVGYLTELQQGVGERQQEVQALEQQLLEHSGPNYDENAIRQAAAQLGDATAEIAADSVILQSRIEAAMTQEQRDALDEAARQQQEQMRQMQEQMQQQQQQQAPQ